MVRPSELRILPGSWLASRCALRRFRRSVPCRWSFWPVCRWGLTTITFIPTCIAMSNALTDSTDAARSGVRLELP